MLSRLLPLFLNNFINGRLDLNSLWRVLEQQQRYRPKRTDPSFGSGRFGRGTVWGGRRDGFGGGFSRGGLGRGTFPGGRRGGGGFRTGGGF